MCFPNSRVGKFFQNYYLSSVLEDGTKSCVYLATDITNDNQVAVKIIGGSKDNQKLFQVELAAWKRLSSSDSHHPQILKLLDYGIYEPSKMKDNHQYLQNIWSSEVCKNPNPERIKHRLFFFVSPLFHSDMNQFVESNVSQEIWFDHPEKFLHLIQQCLAGLQHIHSCKLAHRDIKPANIFYDISKSSSVETISFKEYLRSDDDYRLNIVLADFGFTGTHKVHQKSHLQSCNLQQHTPCYFSPEGAKMYRRGYCQMKLPSAQKSDLWSLGVSLWEIFFGNAPHFLEETKTLEETYGVLCKIRNKDISSALVNTPVLTSNAKISCKISKILLGLLKPLPFERMTIEEAQKIIN